MSNRRVTRSASRQQPTSAISNNKHKLSDIEEENVSEHKKKRRQPTRSTTQEQSREDLIHTSSDVWRQSDTIGSISSRLRSRNGSTTRQPLSKSQSVENLSEVGSHPVDCKSFSLPSSPTAAPTTSSSSDSQPPRAVRRKGKKTIAHERAPPARSPIALRLRSRNNATKHTVSPPRSPRLQTVKEPTEQSGIYTWFSVSQPNRPLSLSETLSPFSVRPRTNKKNSASSSAFEDLPIGDRFSKKRSKQNSTTGSCASTHSRRWPGSGRKSRLSSNQSSSGATGAMSGEHSRPSDLESRSLQDLSGFLFASSSDNQNEDHADFSHLQALLESRGVPPHLFGASVGPRMTQILSRSSSQVTKANQLLTGLQSDDECVQLQAVMEMCHLLVMGNEETLGGFPTKQVVPALANLLKMEHNFDIMNHSCRALTYLMESLPSTTSSVVEIIPVFLEKLQSIQCMDVAEQSLTALETLSKRHYRSVLKAGGMNAVLLYIEFFSLPAQRSALSIAANCSQSVGGNEFNLVADNIPMLSQRLLTCYTDKKSLDSVVLCFSRLVDCFQSDEEKLQQLAAHSLLQNLQHLLVTNLSAITPSSVVMIIHMMATICAKCSQLAVNLLNSNIKETIKFLLFGSSRECQLLPKSPQELYEITSLICELMPKLPTDGVFEIDSSLWKMSSSSSEQIQWQWKDDKQQWHSYTKMDNRIIECAFQNGEEELCLSIMGRTYTIDFQSLRQSNEETGTSRQIQRRTPSKSALKKVDADMNRPDLRLILFQDEPKLSGDFISSLFAGLYHVYSSSTGSQVKHKSLRAMLRMINIANAEYLREILQNFSISSHIAHMLLSQDLKIVVSAMQMSFLLIEKLPDVFSVYFRREGVMHEMKKLAECDLKPPLQTNNNAGSSTVEFVLPPSPMCLSITADSSQAEEIDLVVSSDSLSSNAFDEPEDLPPSPSERANNRLRKTSNKRSRRTKSESSVPVPVHIPRIHPPSQLANQAVARTPPLGATPPHSAMSRSFFASNPFKPSRPKGASGKLFTNLNPVRWGTRSASSAPGHDSYLSGYSAHRERIRTWIREQANRFVSTYLTDEEEGKCHPALDTLTSLKRAVSLLDVEGPDAGFEPLCILSDIVCTTDVSAFEVLHSGLPTALHRYLCSQEGTIPRNERLKRMCHVFYGCPSGTLKSDTIRANGSKPSIGALVNKLFLCVNQLEQFTVKIHDLASLGSSSSLRGNGSAALKFFNTHQLKCQLQRHPSCTTLRQWRGGPVKIDPLAFVTAVERFLIVRGYAKSKNEAETSEDEEEDISSDELDDHLFPLLVPSILGNQRHRLRLYMNDQPLPYDWTVFQAVRHCSHQSLMSGEESTDDEGNPMGRASIWIKTHVIQYATYEDTHDILQNMPTTSKKMKKRGSSSHASPSSPTIIESKHSLVWTSGDLPKTRSMLMSLLTDRFEINDPCGELLSLLRILHGIDLHWGELYPSAWPALPRLPASNFISSQLNAKVARQTSDPLALVTGCVPDWVGSLARKCGFLLSFEVRQTVFSVLALDRDRALSRLHESSNELGNTSSESDRITPRIERKKNVVKRTDLMKQAESILGDIGVSRALLEFQFEDEVGSGLGPTLEWYSLVSQELLRADLDMWRGDPSSMQIIHQNEKESKTVQYVDTKLGLFPRPVPRNVKASSFNKVKSKFRLLGKFMAKALLDNRLIDIPLSVPFYKWLLDEEDTLCGNDLFYIDEDLFRTYKQLERLVIKKQQLEADSNMTAASLRLAIESLAIDDCNVEDLGLDFVLPGYNIELKKSGKDESVTIHNLEAYLALLTHWTLREGVYRQIEELKEGFSSVLPLSSLRYFVSHELDLVFCGSRGAFWTKEELIEATRADHGYVSSSQPVVWLFDTLAGFNRADQRLFLQFITGSPRLPVGGFKALNPQMTIVRKTVDEDHSPDEYLPSVMTCVNYLKLPDYSSHKVLASRLRQAIEEGQRSFDLS